jgi:hypothetical protein
MVTHYLPNKLPSTITEDDVSGEYLEALRLVVERSVPDLKVGEATGLTYDDVMDVLGGESIFKKEGGPAIETIGEIIRTTLGNFGVKRTADGYEVFDTYDYEPVHEGGFKEHVKEAFSDYQNESFYSAARTMGGYFMPENADGSSKENALRVNIKIPQEPKVVNIDYDDDIPEGAKEFVFRGAMTNKRKSIWDKFTSLFISPAEAAEPIPPFPEGVTANDPIADRVGAAIVGGGAAAATGAVGAAAISRMREKTDRQIRDERKAERDASRAARGSRRSAGGGGLIVTPDTATQRDAAKRFRRN